MKVKVSDYIAGFLADHGIRSIFTVVGGGAMHLNDSLGHHPGLKCIYNHHEQASAMAAEAYYRVNNEMAVCCVTSGPGAINALNGVVGAYQDSIPMIVLSGQTKTSLMTCSSGLPLRTLGNQEYDIVPTLQNATKYAATVMKAEDIRYELEKAYHIALSGRPGPCWLEAPVDIQGSYVETDDLAGYDNIDESDSTDAEGCIATDEAIDILIDKLKKAKRPVIYAGNGIRISGGVEDFHRMLETVRIPVVTGWVSIDLIETDHELYVGRAGIMGDRPGNFAVQNSDLVIAIGNRLSIYQVGYNIDAWARGAYVICVDIDPLELRKPTVRIDMPICCDAKEFIQKLTDRCSLRGDLSEFSGYDEWISICNNWKYNYPVVTDTQKQQKSPVNVYALIDTLSRSLPDGSITVAANGSASVVGSAAYYIGKGSRYIMNCALSSMGYELPGATGVAVAVGNADKEDLKSCQIICLAGDGSIMMNLQELQTIVTNKLPVKIVLINNQGYHQIRLTQTNLFDRHFVGIGPESGDLGFPDFGRIADAFGIPYIRCDSTGTLSESIERMLDTDGYCMLEVFCDTIQAFEPKSATRRLEDGTLVSPPLEDLAPFLDREELKENTLWVN